MKLNKLILTNHTNFGAKIDNSAILSFANIGYYCKDNNQYDEFKASMKEIREIIPEAIIKRKGGTGLCISIPAVFKEALSKTDSKDIPIIQYFKNPSLETLKEIIRELKQLEKTYISATTIYKDITGQNFSVPKIFLKK